MTESQQTLKLLKELRKRMRNAVIFKHHNFYTAGVPDFSVSLDGRTVWFECKLERNEPTKLQRYYLDRLAPHAYVITFNDDKTIRIGEVLALDQKAAIDEIVFLCRGYDE